MKRSKASARRKRSYTTTFNGCYFTNIKVFPENWNQPGASCRSDWYFWYRFYDPEAVDSQGKPKPKLVSVRGMNVFKTLGERREATEALLKEEMHTLCVLGFNPITRQFMVEQEEESQGDIAPTTPFVDALYKAMGKLNVTHHTMRDIKSVVKAVEKAAKELRFSNLPISTVSRKHLKKVLERCGENAKQWSATRFNCYRGYLMMLFKELMEQEAITGNPVRDISKKTITKKIRRVLTHEERARIDKHLAQVFPRFRMFVHLFFHSGGRKTELLQLKPTMVDLKRQKYRCVVKKRKVWTEVERTIKDVAVPFWSYFLKDCPNDYYIFGKRFEPNQTPMGIDMPSRYWNQYVKAGLGIESDFYGLKHLNTTEVVDQLSAEDAARLNAHTSPAMVVNIYDVRHKERQHERIRKVNNTFA